MDDLEAQEAPESPEAKEILVQAVQHCLCAWILFEYYNSFSLNVLFLRGLQIVRASELFESNQFPP